MSRRGIQTLSLDAAYECLRDRRVPRRAILLTFDDAFDETVERASRALLERDMQAAVFAPAGLLGQEVRLEHPRLAIAGAETGRVASAEALRRWASQGLDVGSHSLSHSDLTALAPDEIRRQVSESKVRLEDVLSRQIDDFCYPFALHNAAARQEVAAAGFRAAYAGEPPVDDLFAVPRMMIFPHDSLARFRRKVSGYYHWLSAWHRRLRPNASSGRAGPYDR